MLRVKIVLLLSLFVTGLFFVTPQGLFAQEMSDNADTEEVILKKLEINRRFLQQFEEEYDSLTRAQYESGQKTPPPSLKRKIEGLKYKIQALKDDSERLGATLKPKERAGEFLKDLIVQKEVNPEGQTKETEERVQRLHEIALGYVTKSRFSDALKLYEEILLADPDDDQAYLIMGHIALISGEYEKAENAFHNAIHINANNFNEITPFYENMIMRNPGDDMAYVYLGYAYLMLDRGLDAKKAFNDALQINPRNVPAKNGLGVLAQPV